MAVSTRRTSRQLHPADWWHWRRLDVWRLLYRQRHVLQRHAVAGRWRHLASHHRTQVNINIIIVIVITGEHGDVLSVVQRSCGVAVSRVTDQPAVTHSRASCHRLRRTKSWHIVARHAPWVVLCRVYTWYKNVARMIQVVGYPLVSLVAVYMTLYPVAATKLS